MFRPDPAQAVRLSEIIENLTARLTEANQQAWLGEVEGLEASLAAATQKLAAMQRAADRKTLPVELVAKPTAPGSVREVR
jgi:hypothetical protein